MTVRNWDHINGAPGNEDMFDDLVNAHMHAALDAWREDDIPEMTEQARRVVALGERWEQQHREQSTQEVDG